MNISNTTDQEASFNENLVRLVKQIMSVDQITWGRSQDNYLVSFEGRLYQNGPEAYEKAADLLKAYQITPVFRRQDDIHVVILSKGLLKPRKRPPTTNIILFVFTFLSILFAGILTTYTGPMTADLSVIWSHVKPQLNQSLAFAVSLLGILTAHEFGHYFAARFHNTSVTLPYFIPFPLSPFGTMGAFISLQEPPRNKRALLDIGLAGPLAGLIVAVPVLIIGLSKSTLAVLPEVLPENFTLEGNSLLYLGLKYLVHGQLLPTPASYEGINPLIYWVRYFFTSTPLPRGGTDVLIHPVAWAGWAGLLVTALNLLPAGQLDGGHIISSLFGSKANRLRPLILGVMVLLGFIWSGWWLWAFLILTFGRIQAEPLDGITELDPRRKWLAWFGLLIFFLVFTPVPLLSI